MKILVLLKMDERDANILDFVNSNFPFDEKYLLNIVQTPGNIPTQLNGEVLDGCSEFDLSQYLKEQEQNNQVLKKYHWHTKKDHSKCLVGNMENILNHEVSKNQIDLIISGSHISSGKVEDFVWATFAGRILQKARVPYLSIKSDEDLRPIKTIGLVRDFKEPKEENLEALIALQKRFSAGLTMFKINTPNDSQSKDEIMANMQDFVNKNYLNDTNLSFEIIEAKDKETGVKKLVDIYELDLLGLGQIERKGSLSFLRGNLKTDILNHVNVPIYIY